jgi:hypothetical protein
MVMKKKLLTYLLGIFTVFLSTNVLAVQLVCPTLKNVNELSNGYTLEGAHFNSTYSFMNKKTITTTSGQFKLYTRVYGFDDQDKAKAFANHYSSFGLHEPVPVQFYGVNWCLYKGGLNYNENSVIAILGK